MNKISTAIQSINQQRKGNSLYLTLNVGDIVYTIHNGCIKQAKITEIESRLFLAGMVTTIHSDTKFKAILATGETISREYDTKWEDYCKLYPSVEMARINRPFRMDIDTTLNESGLILTALAYECNGVHGKYDGYFTFYLRGADPKEIGYHYALYSHDDSEIVFVSKWDKYPSGTIDELEENGLFTTYNAAYDAFKPKVITFPTEDENPTRKQKKRLTIEIEFECEDEEILSEIEGLADEYHATISISKI